MKRTLLSIFVLLPAILLSACAPGAPTPSLLELQATAMAAAQGSVALTVAAMPTSTPLPTATLMLLPTPAPATLPPVLQPSATPTSATESADTCNVAVFNPDSVDVTIPDGTVMVTGQTFTKTWRIYNGGTCTWNTGYALDFVQGDQMGGPDSVSLTDPVPPGHELQISVPLKADSQPGVDLVGNWRMQTDAGVPFGTYLTVEIQVNERPNATATASPTATSTATATPTP